MSNDVQLPAETSSSPWTRLFSAKDNTPPSDASASDTDTEDEEYWQIQERELMRKEFEESMQQCGFWFLKQSFQSADSQWIRLKVLLELVLLPYAGKFLGRKLAFWGTLGVAATAWLWTDSGNGFAAWAKYVDLGLLGFARSLLPFKIPTRA